MRVLKRTKKDVGCGLNQNISVMGNFITRLEKRIEHLEKHTPRYCEKCDFILFRREGGTHEPCSNPSCDENPYPRGLEGYTHCPHCGKAVTHEKGG